MIKLKEIYLEYSHSWSNSKYYNSGKFITSGDLDILNTWVDAQIIKFDKYQGKIYFHTLTKFPRYKFTEYVRTGTQKVRRVREPKSADAVVLDLKECKKILTSSIGDNKIYEHIGNYQQTGIELYTETEKDPGKFNNIYQGNFIRNLNSSTSLYLSALIELYNNFNTIKILDVVDINASLNTNSILDASSAADIEKLFKSSDSESIKLGMELMTNYLIEESLLYIMLLGSTYGRKMRDNSYWYSTSWKSYLNNLDSFDISERYFQYSQTPYAVIEEFLKKENKKLLQQDIDYIKDCILSQLKETYSLEDSGFSVRIAKEDITLNIDPSNIIITEVDTTSDTVNDTENETLVEEHREEVMKTNI